MFFISKLRNLRVGTKLKLGKLVIELSDKLELYNFWYGTWYYGTKR